VPAAVYDVDLFETPAETVAALHARGTRVVCYFSAGTRERGRPDPFPRSAAGRRVEGWPDERWLDIRRHALRPVLRRRLDLCARKGFDGVEADNVDGYANATGFRLRARDQLRFNRFLAREAHARGLSIALKNDLGQARQLARDYDWALVEQCFAYRECERLRPFVDAGKAVWAAEYGRSCPPRRPGFATLLKRVTLGPWRVRCQG
jgi:hypothetical protein